MQLQKLGHIYLDEKNLKFIAFVNFFHTYRKMGWMDLVFGFYL